MTIKHMTINFGRHSSRTGNKPDLKAKGQLFKSTLLPCLNSKFGKGDETILFLLAVLPGACTIKLFTAVIVAVT